MMKDFFFPPVAIERGNHKTTSLILAEITIKQFFSPDLLIFLNKII